MNFPNFVSFSEADAVIRGLRAAGHAVTTTKDISLGGFRLAVKPNGAAPKPRQKFSSSRLAVSGEECFASEAAARTFASDFLDKYPNGYAHINKRVVRFGC